MIQLFERILTAIIVTIFLFFVLITFGQVVMRYVFSDSLAWIDELSRYCFIWLVFLAGAIMCRKGAHLAIDLIEEMAPPKVRRFLLILADLGLIGFAALVGIPGNTLMQHNWTSLSPAMGVPIAWVQLILPIFGVLATLFSIAHLVDLMRGRTSEGDEF
ncbi:MULTISPECIES: TRAP transporter small permease [unclassified Thalassospira]|jgi:TRAP-type C4-dicarboxylate transport system permease small subunit|uniref:TRAP transporter small permease n=1 Tax=unclassified Thalassospira TaxID=2648997 RepID=UPI000A1D683E|nr:TRAP transporter small permease [Thalassospira sp. MCCC 1A01428]